MSDARRRPNRKNSKHRLPPGSIPGQLTIDPSAPSSKVRLFEYNDTDRAESDIASVSGLRQRIKESHVAWIQVEGLGNEAVLRGLQEEFQLHRLAMEDVTHAHQRPKVEDYPAQLFAVMPIDLPDGGCQMEQLSMFLCGNVVISFQETSNASLEPIRERLRKHLGLIRGRGADYLFYNLIDTAIDSFFPTLDYVSNQLESLELEGFENPPKSHVSRIHAAKRDLLVIRRNAWPLRDMTNSLLRDHAGHFAPETLIHLRDCYDHTVQIVDILEMYREATSSLMDLYFTTMSTKTNEVMKVLTVIGAIFMPLNFIAAVYGMNFDTNASPWNMPELGWYFGYPFSIALMVGTAAGLLIYFRRSKWI